MSVFLANLEDNSLPTIRRVRKKYHTKYNAKYKDEYPWALPSSKGELYAFCELCSVDISIKSVGAKGLRDHEATCRHTQKAHESGYRSSISSYVGSVPPTQGCYEHPTINMSVASHQSMGTVFTSTAELASTFTTSRVFPVEKDSQNQLVSMIDQNSVLSSNQATTTLASTSYPVLEAVEGEMQPSCRNPPPPQTPNTPSSPLTQQDNFVQKLSQSSSNTLHTLTNAIPEEFHAQTVSQDPLLVDRRIPSSLMCYMYQPNIVDTKSVNISTCTNEINNQKYIKRSESPSVEDLTCNFCSKVFSDWKELKKDLMEHIKNANAVKGDSVSTKINEKETKGKVKRIVKQKKIQSSDGKNIEVTRKKRGRPPGKKKLASQTEGKVVTNSENSSFTDSTNNDSTFSSYNSNSFQSVKQLKKKRGRRVKKNNDGHKQTENHSKSPVVSESSRETTFCSVGILNENVHTEDNVKNKTRINKTVHKRRSGQLQCRVCRVVFQSRLDLKGHYQVEHNNGRPYWCQTCHKSFTTKNNLEVHERHKHIEGPNPCMCSVCGKVLSSRTNLKIHLMIHKGEKPFCCPVCSKSFSRKANMQMHMVYHTGERCYTCENCGQSFFALSALRRHIKLHSGLREFACEVCGATYVTLTDLKRHSLKHQAVKPFPCTICDKQFTRSHDLKVHMRYHNKEIRFTCNICGKQFVESGNFRRHMRRHTGERPYTCTVCQQTFTQVHHYKVHVRTNHPDQADDVEWNSNSVRSYNKNSPSFNQRPLLEKRPQKNPPVMNAQNKVPDSVISHQICPPPVTSTVSVNSLPEHVHNIHSLHIPNANNNTSSTTTLHSQPTSTISNLSPISNSVVNMPDIHHSHTSTVTPSVAHVPMMSTHHSQIPQTSVSHPPTGFIQYNSYIYNTGVISPYQPLFDMCPQ